MYALVKTGGKQYRVAKDDTILVERIAAEEGAQVILDDVVMLGDGDNVTIGTPTVAGAAVSAMSARFVSIISVSWSPVCDVATPRLIRSDTASGPAAHLESWDAALRRYSLVREAAVLGS